MLNRIEVTTAYPFLLNVYKAYEAGNLLESELSEVLSVLENFLVRRFVCSVPTYGLNKMFPTLYAQARVNPHFVDGVKDVLRSKQYPRDVEFRERLITSRLYGPSERIDKTKIVLERLEESFEHQEQVNFDELQIEHVMPQTLTDVWKLDLGDDWEATHELLLHTLGNLTLTGYNAPLSNDEFTQKKKILVESHLELNKYFAKCEMWGEQTIRQRAEVLADQAIKVWRSFAKDQVVTPSLVGGVTGTSPSVLMILGKRFQVTTWREVEQLTLEVLGDLDEAAFEKVLVQFPRFVGSDLSRFRSPRRLKNGQFMEANLSANSIQRLCVQLIEAVGLSPEDWRVEVSVPAPK